MSRAGKRIIASAEQTLAFARGEETEGFRVHIPRDIDVRAIRAQTGLSQAKFAERIGAPVATLRNWEQGRRVPDGPAHVLLALISKRPAIVEETLGLSAA